MGYVETIRRVRDGHFERAPQREKDGAVRDLIKACSLASSAVAVQPIPLLDTALVSPIQLRMMQAIGRVYGYELDKQTIVEIVRGFRRAFLLQNAIMAGAKLIPFAGWIIATRVAYALTYAIGEVTERYFHQACAVPEHELVEVFNTAYRQKTIEWRTKKD